MPRSRKSCTGKFKRLTRALRRFERLEDRRVLAAVSWDGGGADNDWSNPLNWSNDLLPTAADDVTLNSNNIIEFDIAAGATVASLDLQASLRVTQGALQVVGDMDVSSGRNLIVAGSTAALTSASGNIDGVEIDVVSGGTANLGSGTVTNTRGDLFWTVEGVGSVLSFPNLTTITNGTGFNWDFFIDAFQGGTINLPSVTEMIDPNAGDVQDRQIRVWAEGAGSTINLPMLQNFVDHYAFAIDGWAEYSTLRALNGGTITLGMLTNVRGVYFPLDGTGTIDTSTITQMTESQADVSNSPADFSSVVDAFSTEFVITGVDVDLSSMVSLDGGGLNIDSGSVQLNALTSIDGTNFILNAVNLEIPSVTSVVNTRGDVFWTVTGASSVLSFPNLTTITNGTGFNWDFFIDAFQGGTINLPSVTEMIDPNAGDVQDRQIRVWAEGAGSTINLPMLQNFVDHYAFAIDGWAEYSTLRALNGGTITLGMLTNVRGVYFPLDGTGTIDTSTITQMTESQADVSNSPADFSSVVDAFSTEFVITGVDVDLSSMVSLDGGGLNIDSGSVQLNALTSIDGTNFILNAVNLEIPSVTSVVNTRGDVFWTVTGASSVLSFPNLTTITNGTGFNWDFFIDAFQGGTINLPSVTEMIDPNAGDVQDRQIRVWAEGAGSTINLPMLQNFVDHYAFAIDGWAEYSTLRALNGGTITLGMLTNVRGVYFPLDGTGTIDTSTITQMTESQADVSNSPADFSSVVDAFSTEFVITGVDVDLSSMVSLDGGGLNIDSGSVHLNALTSIDGTNFILNAVNLEIPSVTSVVNTRGDVFWTVTGASSVLSFPNLTTITNGTGFNWDFFIDAFQGGTINLPSVTEMIDPNAGDVQDRQIRVWAEGAGSTINLPMLQNFVDHYAFAVTGGGEYSTLRALNGGTIALGMLNNVQGVYFPLDGTGTIDTSTITQMTESQADVSNSPADFSSVVDAFSTEFVITGVDVDLSSMVSLDRGLLNIDSGTAQVNVLNSIDGTNLILNAASLQIPNVTSVVNERGDLFWTVTGASSALSLPNLTTITNGTGFNWDFFIDALQGGTINLPSVTEMIDPNAGDVRNRQIRVRAQGAGSNVSLQSLQNFVDHYGFSTTGDGEYSTLQALLGGTIELGQNTSVVGTYVPIDASSSIVAGRLTLGDSSLMSGAGEFFGTLHNSSTLQVAESGLRIHGDFEQTPTGVMQVAVSGAPATGSYSMLDIDGFAQLDGNLELDLVGGFQPDLFSTYDVLRAATVNSQFSSLTGDNTAAPMIEDHYGASAVVLSRDFAAAPYNTMTYTNAVAGNRVFFNVLNTEDDAVEYRMYSPTGAFIFASNSTPSNPDLGDFGPITLGEVGDYEIRQYKDPAANPVTSYEIFAADIDVFQTALNSSETGALQNPGSIDLWQFDVPEAGEIRFHVLALEGDGPMQFKVREAGGQIVFVAQENPGIGPRPQHMIGINNPGSYVLEVSGVGDSTGSYQFTLGESLVEVLVPLPSGVTHAIVSRDGNNVTVTDAAGPTVISSTPLAAADGNNVTVTDAAGPTVISSTPLAAAQSLILVGSGAANQLVEIDFVTGGVFDLPGGIEVLGGASTSDELRILGDNAIQARHVSDDQVNLFHPDGVPNVRYSEMEERTFNGLLTFMAEGVLNIGSGALAVESVTPVRLDGIVTLAGTGSLDATNSVVLAAGASLIGAGSVNAAFSGQTGSFIQATGNLAIGDGTSPIGFATDGVLEVGSHQVTLLDSNQAVLGSLTSLGVAGVQAGTVQSDHGFLIDFGNNVTGWGELQSPNLPADLVMHNGAINGNSVAEPVTLSGFVKGVGSVDFAEFTGTYTPGFSPAVIYNGSTTYAAGSTTIVELGGTSPGVGGHDQINHSGTATLGGTLQVDLIDSFAPVEGQSFVVMTAAAGIVGTFDDLILPTPPAGTRWDVNYEANQLVLEVADAIPPAVSSVIVGSSSWGAPFIDTVDGGGAGAGNGLGYELAVDSAPLPWNDLDRIYVQFSEDVSGIIDSNVQLLDSNGLLNTSVVYDANTFTATISTPVLQFSKLRLGISDLVADQAGNALDGNDDQAAGGIFDLRFDVVPADANRDGRVNGSDFGPFSVAFLTQVGQANYNPFADWNADTRVNGSDLAVFSVNFLNSINTLADPDVPFSGGGGGEGESRSGESKYFGSKPGIDTFFGELGDQDEEEELFFSR